MCCLSREGKHVSAFFRCLLGKLRTGPGHTRPVVAVRYCNRRATGLANAARPPSSRPPTSAPSARRWRQASPPLPVLLTPSAHFPIPFFLSLIPLFSPIPLVPPTQYALRPSLTLSVREPSRRLTALQPVPATPESPTFRPLPHLPRKRDRTPRYAQLCVSSSFV